MPSDRLADDSWDDLAAWWIAEADSDPSYRYDVDPMLIELVPSGAVRLIDLGCGDGHGMRLFDHPVVGVDSSAVLAAAASSSGHTIVGRLPDLSFVRDDSFDAAYAVYLVDLIEDHHAFFQSCARIVEAGGALIVIVNHPVYTAPGSAPLMDDDGEVLWRWGAYLEPGSATEPAGLRTIRYFHRSIADLVTAAADAGWQLEAMVERSLSHRTVAEIPGFAGQDGIPRLLGARWRQRSAIETSR